MSKLDPKQLALIKRHARARRISDIRKRVATLGVTLVAVFSGTILVRSQLDSTPIDGSATASAETRTDGSSSVYDTATNAITPVVGGGGDESGNDDESQSVAPVTVTPAPTTTVAPAPTTTVAPAPTPAPLVTSQS